MNIIEVNHNTCTKCGICADSCSLGLIDFKPDEFPIPGSLIEQLCIKCGHCVAVCPSGSLTHRNIPVEKCLPIQNELQITSEQCEQLLKSRRSIRVYKNTPVPRDIILKLIDIARYSPSGHNSQNIEWLVIDNKNDLQHIREVGIDWMRWNIKSHPEILAFFDLRIVLSRMENGVDELLRGAPVLIITCVNSGNVMASTSCTIALSYLELAAKSMGLGCCWSGLIHQASTSNFPPMTEALAIPKGYVCCGSMLLGYPKYKYPRIPVRNPPNITWH